LSLCVRPPPTSPLFPYTTLFRSDGSVSVDKLIGMPRGIVGSERGGVLTNQLKDNPYCVVLLDEVEKASPNTLNLFLQAFDEGWIDRKSTRLNSSHRTISYAVFCL